MEKILKYLNEIFDEELKLLDVGSGPISYFNNLIDINKWNIMTVDPLSYFYNSLNKKYGVNYYLKCIEGFGENLNKLFSKNSFHFILSRNAIDHSSFPNIFMQNLINVLKPGGFLYISGVINVGSETNWMGLHKHNLYLEDDDIKWTNKNNSIKNKNITRDLNVSLYYKYIKESKTGNIFIIIYKKNKNK